MEFHHGRFYIKLMGFAAAICQDGRQYAKNCYEREREIGLEICCSSDREVLSTDEIRRHAPPGTFFLCFGSV